MFRWGRSRGERGRADAERARSRSLSPSRVARRRRRRHLAPSAWRAAPPSPPSAARDARSCPSTTQCEAVTARAASTRGRRRRQSRAPRHRACSRAGGQSGGRVGEDAARSAPPPSPLAARRSSPPLPPATAPAFTSLLPLSAPRLHKKGNHEVLHGRDRLAAQAAQGTRDARATLASVRRPRPLPRARATGPAIDAPSSTRTLGACDRARHAPVDALAVLRRVP